MSARPPKARAARWLLLAALGGGLIWLFVPSREQKVRSAIAQTAEVLKPIAGESAAARRTRVERELGSRLTPELRVDVPGIAMPTARAALVERVLMLSQERGLVIQIEHVEVDFDRADHARARFDAIISDSQVGDLHGDSRQVAAELEKRGSDWLISSLSSSPEARAEPEARP